MKFVFSIVVLISSSFGTAAIQNDNLCNDIPNSVPEVDKSTHKFTGCKLTAIVSGSEYSDLRLKVGDVVPPTEANQKDMETQATEVVR